MSAWAKVCAVHFPCLLAQSLSHALIGRPAIGPVSRTRHLFQPVDQVHATQVVEVVLRELHFFARDPVGESIGLDYLIEGAVERCTIHGTVQVGEALRSVADQGADLGAALERQGKPLEHLGPIDRVEHPRPADVLRAALRRQETEDRDQMRQIGLLCVRDLLDADPDQEIGHALVVLIHRSHLAENVGLSLG